MDAAPKLLLGKTGLAEAQALRARLAREGIEVAFAHNDATCTKGCSIQVEIWVHPDDAVEITKVIGEDRRLFFESMGYDANLADQVFDPEAAVATCPACGTTFPTKAAECPECGLCFDVPGGGGHACG